MAFGDVKGVLTLSTASITASPSLTGDTPTVAIGDLIYVVFGQQTTATITSFTDNLGNTYVPLSDATDAGTTTGRAFYSVVTEPGVLTSIVGAATASTNDAAGIAGVFEGPFETIDANPANLSNDLTSPLTCPPTGVLNGVDQLVVGWLVMVSAVDWAATAPNLLVGQVARNNCRPVLGAQAVSATTSVSPAFTAGANPTASVLGTSSFLQAEEAEEPLGTPSMIEIARNVALKTVVDAEGVHTLVVTAGVAGTPSMVEWGRNAFLATNVETINGVEVHTLHAIDAAEAGSPSFIHFGTNFKVLTDVDGEGVHTLIVTEGDAGTTSYVELGRNPLLATDEGAEEVHTLKYIPGDDTDTTESFVMKNSNPQKIKTDVDAEGVHTLHLFGL